MDFNLGITTGLKENNRLQAGIYNATFKGVEKGIQEGKDPNNPGEKKNYDVMILNLEVEGFGEFTHKFFAPQSNKRTESQFGENPSQLEHFLVAIRQIADALDPKIGEGIDDGSVKISGTFAQVVNMIKKLTNAHIGQSVQIKLLPQTGGFVGITGFPARITKAGSLAIATRFIAKENLTLTDYEKRKIDTAANAQPTNMASTSTSDILGSMVGQLDEDSDLPF